MLPELQQPNIVGNFLSSYGTAQAQQQAQQDREFNKQRVMKQDGMAEQQFGMQQQKHQFEIAQQVVDMLGSVQDGDGQGFERAKQRWGQMGLPPEAVAGYTVADLPMLRQKAGTQLRELQVKAQQASIEASKANTAQSYAAADASRKLSADLQGRPKPLPQAPQRQENTWIEQTQVAANNVSDVTSYVNKIDAGQFDPGLLKNRYDQAKSFFGVVDPNDTSAINYNNFMADMNRLRNESLRLNVGPQTDQDAKRAWDELFDNINDKTIVRSRLAKIADINRRAARQKAALIQNQRKNYFGPDADAPDWGSFGIDPTLFGQPAAKPAATGGNSGASATPASSGTPEPPPGFVVTR